ncbi:MAG: serine/threonine-protein kinase [Planctomycetota bacterium]
MNDPASLPEQPPQPPPRSQPQPTGQPTGPRVAAVTSRSAAETFLLPAAGEPEKQSEDVALAAALVQSGYLTDRQVSAVLRGWTVHGETPLAEHLRQASPLTEEQLAELRAGAAAKASAVMASLSVERSGGAASDEAAPDLSASLSLVETLEKIDETGRVARLLGVSVAAGGAEHSARRSDARYRLIRKLGQGGLGRVWLARDEDLQRLVALKEITSAGDASQRTIVRFRNEAEITGRLEHPGIVPVHQMGYDADTGFAFYTMRFLGKGTLQDSIDEHHERNADGDADPMRLRRLLTAFVNICHAIGHAHSRSVIHRDLKPENVVIDSFGQVIVIDWGLAKVLDESAVEEVGDAELSGHDGSGTIEGQVLGTPLYMAPEQAAGRLDEVDTRTDIYGLGGILFSIITGRAPHEQTQAEANQAGGGARALISAIVGGPTPNAAKVNRHADAALAAICMRAMARRRYARYQDASELAEEVQRWMAGEPVLAYDEPPLKRVRRWIAHRPRTSQAIALVATLAVASAVTLGLWTQQARSARQQARFEQMRGDAREIELRLRSAADDLNGDARFMAGLPPVQGIVRAESLAANAAALTGEPEPPTAGDDITAWRERLQSIFGGLLRAEPDYLAITFVARDGAGGRELVRVARSVGDRMLVRSLPASRLRRFEADSLLEATLQLEPGDTRASIDPRPRQADAAARVRRLTVATPVYADATGEPFGMVAIEADVTRKIEKILGDLGMLSGDVLITNAQGVVVAGAEAGGGATQRWNGAPVTDIAPAAAPAFAEATGETAVDDGRTVVARRVLIDPAGVGTGIVVTLPAED